MRWPDTQVIYDVSFYQQIVTSTVVAAEAAVWNIPTDPQLTPSSFQIAQVPISDNKK